MSSRRLEKISRAIRGTVSEVIQNHLSDPRVRGMISVTRVESAADLRSARVYLSILGVDEKQQELSLRGIKHAKGYIQSHLASRLALRTCPALSFYLDESLKKGFRMSQLIEQVASEYRQEDGGGEVGGETERKDEEQ